MHSKRVGKFAVTIFVAAALVWFVWKIIDDRLEEAFYWRFLHEPVEFGKSYRDLWPGDRV
jgi:hypothetical protein